MTEMISVPGEMEHEAELRQHDLLKELLTLEEDSGALGIVLWMRIFGCLGDFANGTEKVRSRLRLFVRK